MGATGGIDLGGTKIQAVVVDDDRAVLGQSRRPTPRDGGPAGEIGHMVVKRNGARCPCGRRGCVEAYAGRAALEARARRAAAKGHKTHLLELLEKDGRTRLTSGVWAKALAHQDPLATRL